MCTRMFSTRHKQQAAGPKATVSVSVRHVYPTSAFAACQSGTWGKDCQRDCSCRDSETVCHETTGCEACPAGFEGGDCHEDINECLNNYPCDEHATCSNTIGTFKCICDAGFTQYNDTACQGKCASTIHYEQFGLQFHKEQLY